MKYALKRVSILSALKVSALMHAAFFLLLGVIYGGVLFILSAVSFASGSGSVAGGGMSLALIILSLIGLPLIGLIYGAIVGAVLALLYNAIAEHVISLYIELEEFDKKEMK